MQRSDLSLARRGSCRAVQLLWAAKWRSRESWGLSAGGGEERRVGGEEEVGGGWILGCLVWRVKDRVVGSRLRGWGVSHEGRMERRV